MSQYWGCGKGLFEGFEGFSAFWSEVPSNPLSSQMREQNCNIGVDVIERMAVRAYSEVSVLRMICMFGTQ